MNFDALGNIIEVGDWIACIRSCRTSFSVFPARVVEIGEKSFKAYCGRGKRWDSTTRDYAECDDIRTFFKLENTIKIFPENLPEDVYFKWLEKLEPVKGVEE